jgi:CRISPR/Cas system-associated exonuclease Cas4 (RecB family)
LKLIEIKSIGPEGFTFRKHYKKPKTEHYTQAQIYLYAMKLESGFIIYENKGNQELLIFEITRDDDEIEKYFKKKKKVLEMIRNQEMPKRPYKRESKHCQDCPLEVWCWDKQVD